MSEHQIEHKNIGSCVDPNPLKVERQDPDNFPRLQRRERCALEIAAYVFKEQYKGECFEFYVLIIFSLFHKFISTWLMMLYNGNTHGFKYFPWADPEGRGASWKIRSVFWFA